MNNLTTTIGLRLILNISLGEVLSFSSPERTGHSLHVCSRKDCNTVAIGTDPCVAGICPLEINLWSILLLDQYFRERRIPGPEWIS